MDVATWALARMNMILHGHPTAELWRGNTLSAPHFKGKDNSLKTFDFAVANPPFSAKAWSSGLDPANDEFKRFDLGIPPAKNGDYAFLLQLIKSLKSTGKGAIILPHGVLFRGHKEADIRRSLIQRGLIKGIIGLPANLFYGTGIPACIVVIDKEHAHARTGIFMIDASRGFLKDGNKNRLRAQDIHKIVDVFTRQMELPRYSRMVPVAEIASLANDYNLNIPRYVDSGEPEDLHDLDAHLNGGIPVRDIDALEPYWRVFPTLGQTLFRENGREGYLDPRVPANRLKETILGHAEFKAFAERVAVVFEGWRAAHEPALKGIKVNDLPRELVHSLSKDLLAGFSDLPLLDRYDVYQRLMDYWTEVMQDDVYLIAADGWVEAARPRGIVEDKDRKIKETPDLTIGRKKYKMGLVPPPLVVARYFAKEQAAIEGLQTQQEAAARELEEFVEEHSGEEGLLAEALNDKGKVTKGGVKDRLKAIEDEVESDDERDTLTRCLALIEAESAAAKAVKDAQDALDEQVLARYAKLTRADIKTLVVEDKWLASLRAAVDGEVQRLTQQLAGRVKELEERYAQPLPALERGIEEFTTKVKGHLRKMGLAWG
jgi:type I restriction enzyme M protein